ncbi:hypothetical protein SC10_B2orf00431 [Bacillus paralicheniformis]|nr:hypothetical protein SC10_B2orf00431 [Bacillus paralicheniformis]
MNLMLIAAQNILYEYKNIFLIIYCQYVRHLLTTLFHYS